MPLPYRFSPSYDLSESFTSSQLSAYHNEAMASALPLRANVSTPRQVVRLARGLLVGRHGAIGTIAHSSGEL